MGNNDILVQNSLREFFGDDSIIFDKSHFVGGVTNYNYVMNIGGIDYVVRQPGTMTDKMIDRKIEKTNNKIAYDLGLNSNSVFFDEKTGVKISLFLKDYKNVAQADSCLPENIEKVIRLIKKVHASPVPFPNAFDWKVELNKYEDIIRGLNGDFFSDYIGLRDKLIKEMELNIAEEESVPCHNDTVPENFLVNSDGPGHLIDWEYAGMNDPNWDVAAYILESKLTADAIAFFFEDYYGGEPSGDELTKIKYYMIAQDMLWAVWAQIRHYSGDDFLEYCNNRYERMQNNMKNIDSLDDIRLHQMVIA